MEVVSNNNEMEFIIDKINKYFFMISRDAHKKASLDLIGNEYIASPISFIITCLDLMNEIEPINGKRFLDVGSGIGNICAVANYKGLSAEGIELNLVLCDVSKLMHPDIKVYQMDVREFQAYDEYDIIFYYVPFFDVKLQNELKTKIENDCKMGTYIIVFEKENKDDRFVDIYKKRIWHKVKKNSL